METIIKHDLDFVISMFKKYNTPILSWYWRSINENDDQWLDRRTKLAMSKKKCEGILRVGDIFVSYDIFPDNNITNIYKNKELYITTKYDDLYLTLENIIKEQI